MRFFVGLHHPSHAANFERCMVSANRLKDRRSDFPAREWIMDSGAFTAVTTLGGFPHPPEEYAERVLRWKECGQMLRAVSQDFMCEEFALAATGRTIEEHQQLTVERYRELADLCGPETIMPVLQGRSPADYARCVDLYGSLLDAGTWTGVGSLCRRNRSPAEVEAILLAIYHRRPDLRLHGFGLKLTSLASGVVRRLLYSADSLAWSFAARKQGRDANDWREARAFSARVEGQSIQQVLDFVYEAG